MAGVMSVIGPRGVGKTTGLQHLYCIRLNGRDVSLIHMSQLLNTISRERFGVFLAELESDLKLVVRKECASTVSLLSCNPLILDTHYVEMVTGGRVEILISEESKSLITAQIFVQASPNVVLSRRLADSSGRARSVNIGEIEIEIRKEKELAFSI